MSTVTISKKEYRELAEKGLRYEYLRRMLTEDIFSPPPTKSRGGVMSALSATGRYHKKFLASVRRGLGRSSYFSAR